MENSSKNKILSKYKMPLRRINLAKIARTGKTTIRKAEGVGTTKLLVESYKKTIPLTHLLYSKPELEDGAYKYFGGLYNDTIDATPPVSKKTTTRYRGQLMFEVEVKGNVGAGFGIQGTSRKFIIRSINVPMLSLKEVKELEEREKTKLEGESPYISITTLRHNLKKVRIRQPVNNIMTMPIMKAGAIELDGLIKNSEWCKNNGMCVPDWLIHKYLNDKGSCIKTKVKDINIIQHLATHDFEGELVYDNSPNDNGYTIENIMLFCKNANLPVYILHNGKLIQHDRNISIGHSKSASPLIIEVKNGHLYPITNSSKIKSVVQLPHSSDTITKPTKKEEKIVVGDGTPPPPLNYCFGDEYDDPISYYLQKQRDLNMLQYPSKVRLTGNTLYPFKIEENIYVSAHKDYNIEAYVIATGKEYTGQTAPSLIIPHMDKMSQSYLNHEVMDALTRKGVKNRTHIGLYRDYNEDEETEHTGDGSAGVPPFIGLPSQIDINKTICLDINKAYRDVMETPPDGFMTLGFNSIIEDVETFKLSKFGLWYVETDDLTLLHQSNWYSSTILKVAHKEGIKFKPKYFIEGKNQGINLLKDIIDEIMNTNPNNDADWKEHNSEEIRCGVEGLLKNMINSMSGMLGRTSSKNTYLTCDTDIERVWEDYFKKTKSWETDFVFNTLDEDKEHPALYCWGRVNRIELLSNNLPMYIQILDWANITLHNLIKSTGGYDHLLYRKTDFIMMEDIGQIITPNNKVGGYKIEQPPKRFINMDKARAVEYTHKPEGMTKDTNITTSDDYDKVIALLESGKSLMLDSRAGTGKSYVIKKVSEHFGEKAVRRIAFTNKAANNINGQTINKFMSIDNSGKQNITIFRKRMVGVKVICVDEISMIGRALWKHLYYAKKYFKDVAFLFCGEEAQLPPIETDPFEKGYFSHPTIMMMCDNTYASLELTDKCRYDRTLYDYLTNIKDGTPNPIPVIRKATIKDYLSGTNLVYTNKRRKIINTDVNKYYSRQAEAYLLAEYKGEKEIEGEDMERDEKYKQTTMIYNGIPLLAFVKDAANGLIKNTIHIVKDVDADKGTFKLNQTDVVIGEELPDTTYNIADINNKFIMAYAMTIHKSQGDTLEGQVNIHEYNNISTDIKLYYTAVSRATKLENIKYYF